ncbi:MAG: ABC transporter ATP-binding protein [Candidatus Hydrogenedentota bacterium]
MSDYAVRPDMTAPKPVGASTPATQLYRRLLGFAWQYKARLVLALVFSVIIAASFGAILVSMGTLVKVTFYEAPENPPPEHADPAAEIAEDIRSMSEALRGAFGWAPAALDTRFLDLVEAMRAEPMRALEFACVVVIVLALIIGIGRFLQEYFAGQVCTYVTTDLGEAMYKNIVHQPVGFYESRATGDILARFTNDIFMVNRGLTSVFVKLLREPIKVATFLAIAVSISPSLTLIGICVLPPVGYALTALGRKVRKNVRRSLQRMGTMASVVAETVRGIMIIKGFRMEAYETRRFMSETAKLRRFLMKTIRANAATSPITEIIMVIGLIIFVLISGRRVVAGTLHPADLLQLYFALAMMLDPVRKLASVNNNVQTSVASAERIFEFIDQPYRIVEAPDAVDLPPMATGLRFEGVSFSYDGEHTVLHNLEFAVRRGEMLALIGLSGAGKSTVAKLIPRFYDVTEGRITIDGVDIRRATFASLRDQIGIVTQDTILFNEAIRENITAGHDGYDEARICEAAAAAHALEFIEQLPGKFEARIGEGGSNLSGGQRQRLAIARAMLKDPTILLLDEATSSLDSHSERLIQDALDRFVAGRTTIVIAHRLSTIQRADRILVLDKGAVVEEGTHASLLAEHGLYARLYETQFAPNANKEGATPS